MSCGALASRQGSPSRVAWPGSDSIGSSRCSLIAASARADRDVALGRRRSSSNSARRGVQAEVGQRVHALRGQRPEDRGVGQRVAVDLARHAPTGSRAGRRLGVGRLRAGCSPRRRGGCRRTRPPGRRPDFSRGSRSSRRLILSWEPSGLVAGVRARRRAGSAAPTARRWPAPSRGRTVCERVAVVPGDRRRSSPSDSMPLTPGAGDDLGAGAAGGRGERVGDRAHAADRHPPLAGAVADQVVEEAAVLDQRRRRSGRRRCRSARRWRPRRARCRRRSGCSIAAPERLARRGRPRSPGRPASRISRLGAAAARAGSARPPRRARATSA